MKINLLVLRTSNPDNLASFYKLLGMSFVHHQHGSGPFHYSAEVDGTVFEIYPLSKGMDKADDSLRLGFIVGNLDELIGRLRNFGTRILNEPKMTEWGYVAIVEDADGRKVELKDSRSGVNS